MMLQTRALCLIAVTCLMAMSACGGEDSSDQGGGANNSADANNSASNNADDAQAATVQGRLSLDARSEASAQVYTLVAYQPQSDGQLEVVSTQEVSADSDGTYQVRVDASQLTGGEVLVEATQGGQVVGSVLVFGAWEPGQTYTAADINTETSAEAHVYLEARASGDWNQDCHAVTVRELITAEVASAWEQSQRQDTDLLVRASLSYMISFGEALRDEDTEAGQGDLEEFFALRADLMAEADARDFNQNEDEALDLEARQQSWASVGISPQDAWISVAAATEVMASYLEEAGEQQAGSAQRLRAHSQVELSLRVQAHVEAQMEREEAFDQEDRDAVVEAGAQLRARLEAGTQEETQQAWEAFNASVRARLEGRLELAGQAAFLQVVEAVGAARTTLETSLEVLTSAGGYQAQAETAVGAYLLFQTSVEEMGSLLTATGTSQSQAEATVQVLAALR